MMCGADDMLVVARLAFPQLTYMFANPNSRKSSPCASEALHIDDTVLSVLRRATRKAYTLLRKVIDENEAAVRAALAALGHGDVCALGLPTAYLGEGALSERWHTGRDGCPSGTHADRVLLTATLTLDNDESETLRALPAALLLRRVHASGARVSGVSLDVFRCKSSS